MRLLKIPRILNRELVLLVGLFLFAIAAFVFTKRLAAREQQFDARLAAIWFERGSAYLQAGKTDQAISAFRKATSDTENNPKYALALANALAAEGQNSEAEQLLLRLRESDPESAETNIQLARLMAEQGDTQQAIHYYQNALYGRWAPDQGEARRKVRYELVRFLLGHQQRELASSELLILQARTPDSLPTHLELAKLFIEAGDTPRALQEYAAAARIDSRNAEALIGAGNAAFQLGDYSKAEDYLRSALDTEPDAPHVQELLTLTQKVQSEDPLLPHLSRAERQKRLLAALQRSIARLDTCLSQQALSSEASAKLQAAKAEGTAALPKFSDPGHPPDSDTARSGVGLVYQLQQTASGSCGTPTPDDQALLLIGRNHSGDRP